MASTLQAGRAQLGEGASLLAGWTFALPLLAILLSHELGHFVAARLHGVRSSLPIFLPLPYLSPFGTAGAVIGMFEPIKRRRALLDIGAAGPLAGLVVALPVLAIGLSLSDVKPLPEHGVQEGNSLLYLLLKRAFVGRIEPGNDVFLHPTAFAGWAGLFVTMINLLPVGQLDGGHVLYALLGPRQNGLSRAVHRGLLPLALVSMAVAAWKSRARPFDGDHLAEVFGFGSFWLVWFGLLLLLQRFSGKDHPPTDDEPLGPVRTTIAIGCMVLFVLLFMPAPLTQH